MTDTPLDQLQQIENLTIQKRTAEDAVIKFAHQRDEAQANLAALRAAVVALADKWQKRYDSAEYTDRDDADAWFTRHQAAKKLRALVSGMGPGNEKEGRA